MSGLATIEEFRKQLLLAAQQCGMATNREIGVVDTIVSHLTAEELTDTCPLFDEARCTELAHVTGINSQEIVEFISQFHKWRQVHNNCP